MNHGEINYPSKLRNPGKVVDIVIVQNSTIRKRLGKVSINLWGKSKAKTMDDQKEPMRLYKTETETHPQDLLDKTQVR